MVPAFIGYMGWLDSWNFPADIDSVVVVYQTNWNKEVCLLN